MSNNLSASTRAHMRWPRMRILSTLVALFVTTFIAGFGATRASAVSTLSMYGYSSVAGNEYQNVAVINVNDGSDPWAWARTITSGYSFSAPNGYAGSRGRFYTSSNALWCQSVITYNTGSNSAYGDSCLADDTVGNWYSYGVSHGYNPSTGTYGSFYTFKTTNQTSTPR